MIGDHEYEKSMYEDYRPSDGFLRDSDEDTEDASETESMKPGDEENNASKYRPVDEMKEQCYRSRLAELRNQLAQLEAGCHPDFVNGLEQIKKNYEERKFAIKCNFELQQQRIANEFAAEERAANAEYEERRNEIKENLNADLEEKKRHFETENNDLTIEIAEPRPIIRRQLRRRPNDPIPMPDRRRRASPAHINYMLDEDQIAEDLKQVQKIINEVKSSVREENRKNRAAERENAGNNNANSSSGSKNSNHNSSNSASAKSDPFIYEARIEDGKLFYNKKWFHRGQNVMLESIAENSKQAGNIFQIGTTDLTIRKTSETSFKQSNTKVTLTDLKMNKYSIHRRS